MKPIVYIQSKGGSQPYSVNGAIAEEGFKKHGYKVQFFTSDAIGALDLTEQCPVVGGVGTVHAALRFLDKPIPEILSIPDSLHEYLGRRCWVMTAKELRDKREYPVFIKPFRRVKTFTGKVVENEDELDAVFMRKPGFPEIDDDFELMVQEPITIVSEWRSFVINGDVIGLSSNSGDPMSIPESSRICAILENYSEAPAAYAADFGVTSTGQTILIEINDAYSLGHGSLLPFEYAGLLRTRWEELMI